MIKNIWLVLVSLMPWDSTIKRCYARKLSPYYWIVHQKKELFIFRLSLVYYRIRQWIAVKRQEFNILIELILSAINPFLLALSIIIFLEVMESWLTSCLPMHRQHIPSILLQFFSKINIKQDAYANFVGVMAQLAGVFLGLYFTAISLLFSTMYAKVPEDIRKLLLSEKIGNQYIKVVIHFGAISVLLFLANVMGISLGIATLVYASMLALLTMLSFAVLGIRSFNFFNPTNLMNNMIPDLLKWIRSAANKGLYWNTPSYQDYYRKEAERLLETYNKISCLGKVDEFKFIDGYSLKLLGQYGLKVLSLYAKEKNGIPCGSLWFKKKYEHPSWFMVSYTEVNIRLKTHTLPNVKELPNYLWFEEMVAQSFRNAIETLLERRNYQYAAELAPMIFETLKIYGYNLESEEGFLLLNILDEAIQSHLYKLDILNINMSDEVEEMLLILAVAETSCYSYIGLIAGITERIDNFSENNLNMLIQKINWSKQKSIYNLGLPRCLTQQLETLQKGLNFEFNVEGKVITPSWYIRQIAVLGLVRYTNTVIIELVDWFEANCVVRSEQWLKEEKYILVVHILQRGLETMEKIKGCVKSIESSFTCLASLRVVSDIPWPAPQWDDIYLNLKSLEGRLYTILAQTYPHIVVGSSNVKLPDFFGFSYNLLTEKAIHSLQEMNENLFKTIITTLMDTFFLTRERLLKDFGNLSNKDKTILISEQIIDLLELSGFAFVYSEIDNKNHWEIVQRLWDGLFENVENKGEFAQLLINVADYYKSQFAMYPKSIIRTEWKTKLVQKGMEMGLLQERYRSTVYGQNAENVSHPNPVIRTLFHGSDLYYEATDVFFVVYLMNKAEATELVFEHSTLSFVQSVRGDNLEES